MASESIIHLVKTILDMDKNYVVRSQDIETGPDIPTTMTITFAEKSE